MVSVAAFRSAASSPAGAVVALSSAALLLGAAGAVPVQFHVYLSVAIALPALALSVQLWRRGDRGPALLVIELLAAQLFAGVLAYRAADEPWVQSLHFAGALLQLALGGWVFLELATARRSRAHPFTRRVTNALLTTVALQLLIAAWLNANDALEPLLVVHLFGAGMVLALGALLLVLTGARALPRPRLLTTGVLLLITPALGMAQLYVDADLLGVAHLASAVTLLLAVLSLSHAAGARTPMRRTLRSRGLAERPAAFRVQLAALLALSVCAGTAAAGAPTPPLDLFIALFMGVTLTAAGTACLASLSPGRAGDDASISAPVNRRAILGAIALVAGLLLIHLSGEPRVTLLTGVAAAAFWLAAFRWRETRKTQLILLGAVVAAAAPLIGWTAVAGPVTPQAWTLFAVGLFWGPTHFWSRALQHGEAYADRGLRIGAFGPRPLPFKDAIAGLTLLLVLASFAPLLAGLGGSLYTTIAALFGGVLLHRSLVLRDDPAAFTAMQFAAISRLYIALLFGGLITEHTLFA